MYSLGFEEDDVFFAEMQCSLTNRWHPERDVIGEKAAKFWPL
jgi:hypothetical protein